MPRMKLAIKKTLKNPVDPDAIISLLLKDRGLEHDKTFINPPNPNLINFSSFFTEAYYKKNLSATLSVLARIKENNETIVVYCDYDADGITGGAILWETLHLLGFNVFPHVPDRKTEGYGFSTVGIDLVKEKYNPTLIISVDHGIMGHQQIAYAKTLGIDVIITDHHSKAEKDPADARAIFHTSQLSGSGVAYFFSKTIFEKLKSLASEKAKTHLFRHFLNDYQALAAIGTVADLVPLTGASRSVVKHGLKALSKSQRPGFKHLFIDAGIVDRDMSPYDVGFIIAPRINAFGRLTHAIDALRMLCTVSESKASELAKKSGTVNKNRQALVEVGIEQALQQVKDLSEKIIIVSSPDWNEGIIGLIASKLVEKYYRPAVVLAISDGHAKASVRSISGIDITTFLRKYEKLLISIGGHAMAAGFSIEVKNSEKFKKIVLSDAKKTISDEELIPTTQVDIEIPFELNTLQLAHALERLSPFGVGNPFPVFSTEGQIVDKKLLGKNSDHLKLMIKSDNSLPIECMFFKQGMLIDELQVGEIKKIVYKLEINRWNGREKVNMMGKLIL